jgi:hypothetical protein
VTCGVDPGNLALVMTSVRNNTMPRLVGGHDDRQLAGPADLPCGIKMKSAAPLFACRSFKA